MIGNQRPPGEKVFLKKPHLQNYRRENRMWPGSLLRHEKGLNVFRHGVKKKRGKKSEIADLPLYQADARLGERVRAGPVQG